MTRKSEEYGGGVDCVFDGICDACVAEAPEADSAGIASAAGTALFIGVVAAMSEGVIEAEFEAGHYGLRFCHIDDGGMDSEVTNIADAGGGGEVGEFLELLDIVMPAVRVAGRVGGVDADEDVEGAKDFGPGDGVGEEDCISCGDVGSGNLVEVAEVCAVFWDVDIEVSEGRAADTCHIDKYDFVLGDAEGSGDFFSGFDFTVVSLAVAEGEGVE